MKWVGPGGGRLRKKEPSQKITIKYCMFKSVACDPIYAFVGYMCGIFVCARKKK